MSFSSEIKQELNKNSNLSNKEYVKYELIGYLISGNIDIEKNKLKFSTESDYNINRFSKLLSNLQIDHKIDVTGKIFTITINMKNLEKVISYKEKQVELKEILSEVKNEEYLKAIIKGTFMGSGSVNNPENKYHLEIVFANKETLEEICNLLETLGVKNKKMITENKYSLYIKEGEEISKFLALIGANTAVLKFEEIRVVRDMKNNVNRIVNCETANLNKTINTSVLQINTIKQLKKQGKFNSLPDDLKEIANLRLENPNATLDELGNMLKKPIGKSTVSHRFKRLKEYL